MPAPSPAGDQYLEVNAVNTSVNSRQFWSETSLPARAGARLGVMCEEVSKVSKLSGSPTSFGVFERRHFLNCRIPRHFQLSFSALSPSKSSSAEALTVKSPTSLVATMSFQ